MSAQEGERPYRPAREADGYAWERYAKHLEERAERLEEALRAIADGDYQGEKLWEHKLAASALNPPTEAGEE